MNERAHEAFDVTRYKSILDAQVAELLQRVSSECERRCQALRAAAQQEAAGILRAARTEARANVQRAVSEERARIEHAKNQRKATKAMRERMGAEQRAQRMLTELWQILPGQLQSRWRDAEHRRTWIQAAVRQALPLLSGRPWRIEHGPDLTAAECRQHIEAACNAESARPSALECIADAQISAGLRIRTTLACVDATVPGLLANQADLEASFLAEYGALDT